MTRMDKPVRADSLGMVDRIAPLVTALGAVLTTLGFILSFVMAAPVNGATVDGVELIGDQLIGNQLLFSQKIFYFHMPVAIVSFVALGFTAYYGIRFLMTRDAAYDLRARLTTEIALVFVVMVMFSGEMWERFEWGVWWTWEPRLTTYFILMLLVFGYFILRTAVDEPERRAAYSSVFGIIMFVDVPICFMITRLVPSSVHPTIFRSDSGLSPDMLIPLLLAMFGMFCVGFGIYRLRLRSEMLAQRAERIKEHLDDQR
jgi:heme exporter protein C